jgi:hypothetical protein
MPHPIFVNDERVQPDFSLAVRAGLDGGPFQVLVVKVVELKVD